MGGGACEPESLRLEEAISLAGMRGVGVAARGTGMRGVGVAARGTGMRGWGWQPEAQKGGLLQLLALRLAHLVPSW